MSRIISRRSPTYGLARVISKAGVCSRSDAEQRVRAGRVAVNDRVVLNPEFPISNPQWRISVDGVALHTAQRVYLMLNKPRGLLTTTQDEKNRDTVYECFAGANLPWLAPVGRLDKASEGLLLFSNDSEWSARITDPCVALHKTYHVQINRIPNAADIDKMQIGMDTDSGRMNCLSAQILRSGEKNCWLEIVLDEGKNRQIRRLLQALDFSVLRLIRVAIGPLPLGELSKGQWRYLTDKEVAQLQQTAL
jgi:23S rRNA pseudouridine2605 synthase